MVIGTGCDYKDLANSRHQNTKIQEEVCLLGVGWKHILGMMCILGPPKHGDLKAGVSFDPQIIMSVTIPQHIFLFGQRSNIYT